MGPRVLILSWEYPPVIEGGLGSPRAQAGGGAVRQGVTVDVLTRGAAARTQRSRSATRRRRTASVTVYRVPEPGWPRDLNRFVAWVQRMNEDMLAAGEALAEENAYDLIHGHDWLVAQGRGRPRRGARGSLRHDDPRDRARPPPGVGPDEPQAHIHAVERWMAGGPTR